MRIGRLLADHGRHDAGQASQLGFDAPHRSLDAAGGNGTTSGAQVQNDLPAGSVGLGVTIEPLLAWLWLGGLIIGAGSALTFVRRRHGDEGGS